MQKASVYRIGIMLVCLSLALAACGSGQGTPEDKSGSPQGSQVALPAAQNGYPVAQTTAPAAGAGYPAAQAQPTAAGYPAPQAGSGNQPTQAPQTGLGALQILKPDGSIATLSSADLQKLPPTEVSIGQSDQSGYPLSAVLAAAGITDYQQVIVIGSGGSTPLAKAQVTDDVILSTVDPTSLQLAGSQLSADQMVKGVNQIQVK